MKQDSPIALHFLYFYVCYTCYNCLCIFSFSKNKDTSDSSPLLAVDIVQVCLLLGKHTSPQELL